ncbi:hypothetical protein ACFSHQ_03635 [Gemmobacter lanyuensis]
MGDFGRLHLHGVVDVSGLDDPGVERLRQALIRAASVAEGAIGGERQLDLRPIFDPVSWTDYILKYATRTAKEFGLDDPFMINPITLAHRCRRGAVASSTPFKCSP